MKGATSPTNWSTESVTYNLYELISEHEPDTSRSVCSESYSFLFELCNLLALLVR